MGLCPFLKEGELMVWLVGPFTNGPYGSCCGGRFGDDVLGAGLKAARTG